MPARSRTLAKGGGGEVKRIGEDRRGWERRVKKGKGKYSHQMARRL